MDEADGSDADRDVAALLERGRALKDHLVGPSLGGELGTVHESAIQESFHDYTSSALFGLLYARPGLDLKTRILVTMVSDVVQSHMEELELHLRICRRLGWSEEELGEAILHLAGYIGAPAVRSALKVAARAFSAPLDPIEPR